VVVDQVDIGRVDSLEPEHDPPIARDPYRPVAGEVAFQCMEPEAGKIHVRWAGRLIETRQDPLYLCSVCGRYAASVSPFVKELQAFVPEVDDHPGSVTCHRSGDNTELGRPGSHDGRGHPRLVGDRFPCTTGMVPPPPSTITPSWSTTGRANSKDLEVPTKLDTTGRPYLGCRRAGLGGTELEGSEEPSESYVDGRDRAVGQEV